MPQFEQIRASGAGHSSQNLAFGGFSCWPRDTACRGLPASRAGNDRTGAASLAFGSRTVRRSARVPGPPGRLVRARGDLPLADEVGELVQDEPGIRDRPGIPG